MTGFSGAFLKWRCPERASGSRHLKHIPVDIYEEIFAWIQPSVDPSMDTRSYHEILTCLAPVCRFFAYYAVHEVARCLDFDGGAKHSRCRTPTGPWCASIIKRLQPMETLRTSVKKCDISNWSSWSESHYQSEVQMTRTFLRQFPTVLSRLDNLNELRLSETPISYFLLQAVGRLPALQRLVVLWCNLDLRSNCPAVAIFGIHETPFAVLRQFTMEDTDFQLRHVFEEAFSALVGATTLQSLAIADCYWLHFLLPRISQRLVSLSGDFSRIPVPMFIQFVKAHPALLDLTVSLHEGGIDHVLGGTSALPPIVSGRTTFSYATLDLDRGDLPDLRSFSGPSALAPKFVHSRPVTRLALGCHLQGLGHAIFMPALHGLTVFPHIHMGSFTDLDYIQQMETKHDSWNNLKINGEGIQDLFMPLVHKDTWVTMLRSCFPNVVHLQLELRMWHGLYDMLDCIAEIEEPLRDLGSLKFLTLSCSADISLSFWLSPGDQHDFVHRVSQDIRPTLVRVVLGPWMVWHLRTPRLKLGECHCELELLSPSGIRQALRTLTQKKPWERVRDWKGKMTDVFSGEPLGLDEDVQWIMIP
ncbi:hypothetical protein JB92DRAFT_3147130 [Gautieria morchelliformis]|nr:hypothetical protein JB92DRAFT_3147130 [Gautieria morchelliformis]